MHDLFDHVSNTLQVRVIPKAKSKCIKKEIAEDGQVYYKIYVTAAAQDGKANQAVIDLLAEALNLPKSALKIIRGLSFRDKTIKITR